jgi:hypothetical protein
MLGLIFAILIVVIDVVISLWNSYNSGQIYATNKALGSIFYTLGGFFPMSYMVTLLITFIAGYLGYISLSTFQFLFSFSFLFFGLTIVIWGVIATVTTGMAALKTRDWKAGLLTVFNAIVTVLDAWEYISGFYSAWKEVRRSIDNSDFSVLDVLAILALAVGIGFVVTYVAFREGLRNSRVAYRY